VKFCKILGSVEFHTMTPGILSFKTVSVSEILEFREDVRPENPEKVEKFSWFCKGWSSCE
jgi:hypothetical protein